MSLPVAQPARVPDRPEPTPATHAYPWYVGGVGTWFAAMGMQSVLFSWLVVGELRAEPRWVGIAQSASMVPSFLLILLGGAIADRVDRRRLLVWLHCGAALLATRSSPRWWMAGT
jgi:MFS family permease